VSRVYALTVGVVQVTVVDDVTVRRQSAIQRVLEEIHNVVHVQLVWTHERGRVAYSVGCHDKHVLEVLCREHARQIHGVTVFFFFRLHLTLFLLLVRWTRQCINASVVCHHLRLPLLLLFTVSVYERKL
jgi:hypothetical protein